MILNLFVGIALLTLLLVAMTAMGAFAIASRHPPAGRFVETDGGRLHVLELGTRTDAPPVVLLHGASANLQDMRLTLGERLAARHRVILIDRPGHGWSERPDGDDAASSTRQAALIAQALDRLGVPRAIIVGHSFAGAVVTALALDHPARVAGLALLAPVTHPWPGGIAWFYRLASTPVVGPLFARTIVLPAAFPLLDRLAQAVSTPQTMPDDYVRRSALALLLRPSSFIANASDVARLKASVVRQSPRYAEIVAPTVIVVGDRDTIVSPKIHSRALASTLPHVKLIVLPGIGHAVQHVAADIVVAEIDRLAAQ
jgi:pimeloyl-ACP methyl ester carboxylesterase